jgi:hypothetical protein
VKRDRDATFEADETQSRPDVVTTSPTLGGQIESGAIVLDAPDIRDGSSRS